ncbi:MAG: hypothetical protein ACYCZB_07705 [Acidiphilium sp.]
MNPAQKPILIGAPIYREPIATPPHPLAVLRAPLAEDLIRSMGWLDEVRYRIAAPADCAALEAFHYPAERLCDSARIAATGLGRADRNPLFPRRGPAAPAVLDDDPRRSPARRRHPPGDSRACGLPDRS